MTICIDNLLNLCYLIVEVIKILKEGQLFEVAIAPSTKKWYWDLGYEYPMRTRFLVPPEHLPEGSRKKVIAICDFSGKEELIRYESYVKNIKKNNGKFRCEEDLEKDKNFNDKKVKKAKETTLSKCGVENIMQLDEFKEKIKNSNLEKYGVPYTTQLPEMKDKSKKIF